MREKERKPTCLELLRVYGRMGTENSGPAPSLVVNCKSSLLIFTWKISYIDFVPMPKTDRIQSAYVKNLNGFPPVYKGK